jgi:L-amino acid N-acyltransferase YncA
VEFREPTDADWPAVWAFLQPVLAAGETYTYPRDLGQADARAAWFVSPPWHAMLAVLDDRPVAIAKYGPNHPGAGAHVANASFVVDPAAAGRGIGRALAEHVLAAARARGFRAMQFNAVVATNPAVALWQSLGFTIVGTVPEAFDHPTRGPVGLHVMHRFL